MNGVQIITSFTAGILTFASPCVLPLIPAYLSFITGASLEELKGGGKSVKFTVLNALFFVLGFGFVFTALGASASWLGGALFEYRDAVRWAGGIVVIIFGLHIAGIIRIPFLYYEKRMEMRRSSAGLFGAFMIGLAFALGWTPCIGPVLSSILLLASTQETVGSGVLLLAVYSLGLGVPFLLTALFVNRAMAVFARIQRYYRYIEIVSGVILVLLGIAVLTGSMGRLGELSNRLF